MEIKKIIKKFLVVLAIGIIIVLSVLLSRYIKLYKDASKPKYSYYVIRDAQITYADISNHNAVYENFAIGKYDYNYTIKLIQYIRESNNNNLGNEYYYVEILFKDNKYNDFELKDDDDYSKICEEIKTEKGNYFINVNYNEETGFINLITITKK